jgi:HAD superfamily hydrolase (TIGR01509 family)
MSHSLNAPAPPRAVVFDLGKVLVDFDYGIAVCRLAARAKMSAEEFTDYIIHAPLMPQYETGLLTSEEFYARICTASGFCGSLDEFGSLFADIFSPIEPMIELHAALRRRGLPTYVFSNTNDLAVRHIRRNFPFFATFTDYIFSYEHRAMKPDPRLYQVLEARSGFRGPELLYLDDRPENVEAAAARGWRVILHETPADSRAAIEQLGLLNHV